MDRNVESISDAILLRALPGPINDLDNLLLKMLEPRSQNC